MALVHSNAAVLETSLESSWQKIIGFIILVEMEEWICFSASSTMCRNELKQFAERKVRRNNKETKNTIKWKHESTNLVIHIGYSWHKLKFCPLTPIKTWKTGSFLLYFMPTKWNYTKPPPSVTHICTHTFVKMHSITLVCCFEPIWGVEGTKINS